MAEIDWKKFGMGLSDAVFGIASTVATVAGSPVAGAAVTVAGKGVNQIIDATVSEPENKPIPTPATPPPSVAPAPMDESQTLYAFLIKKGWPSAFAKQLIEQGPSGAPTAAKETATQTLTAAGTAESDVAFWRRSLADPKLSPELKDLYAAQLQKAEQKV